MKRTYIEDYNGVCFKCLQKKSSVKQYKITGRGYGSIFDCSHPLIQVCDECKCEHLEEWIYEEDNNKNNNKIYYENYKYETNIENYVKTFPIVGQELFFNRTMEGAFYDSIPPQDWIDIELGVADDSVYKRNKLITPTEEKEYKTKYPTCNKVFNIIYSDKSIGSRCPFLAFGEFGGKCGINICTQCNNCSHYNKRTGSVTSFMKTKDGHFKLISNSKALGIYKFKKRERNRKNIVKKRK